jgi:hypothetical protein
MDEKGRAATFGLLEQLERDHPDESQEQISERYRKALVADPELMKATVRAVLGMRHHNLLMPREGCRRHRTKLISRPAVFTMDAAVSVSIFVHAIEAHLTHSRATKPQR